ncbi:MAG: undecaprenyl/decaprenyl-phosphate alpha-N-acetylglucosaminyl 1-phosphate transferase [PVC group bacterium]|nr:undecaprenyl/decaprenyl-phosphate alpha-N-acetylglucosaminyl 1-phosphate transferase [PVC group bacterium]
MLSTNVFLFAISFLFCYLLLPVLERLAKNKGYLTEPAPQKIDTRRIPYLGGLALFLVFLSVIIVVNCMTPFAMGNKSFFALMSAIVVIVFFGAYDDLKELSPTVKLIGQCIAAAIVVFFTVHTEIIYFNNVINILLSIFWIVVVINAFNLLDILDGLAGGISFINIFTFFLFGVFTNNSFVIIVSVVLLGCLSAFLRYNLPPASIFMGDAGSQFLGFLQAVIVMALSFSSSGREIGLVIPFVILSIALLDLFFVILMRMKQKKPIFLKSNDHFVFRMLKCGVSQVNILRIMLIFALITNACALVIYRVSNVIGAGIFVVLLCAFFFLGNKLSKLEMNE